VVSDNQITCRAPADSQGYVNVSVTTPAGTGTKTNGYHQGLILDINVTIPFKQRARMNHPGSYRTMNIHMKNENFVVKPMRFDEEFRPVGGIHLSMKPILTISKEGVVVAVNFVPNEDWEMRAMMSSEYSVPMPNAPGVPSMVLGNMGTYQITMSPSQPVPDVVVTDTTYTLVHKPSQTTLVVSVNKIAGALKHTSIVYQGTTLEATDTSFVSKLETMGAVFQALKEAQFEAAMTGSS
jgi:hypothetical protein